MGATSVAPITVRASTIGVPNMDTPVKDKVRYEVICNFDGKRRHAVLFDTHREADAFAYWGHICTNDHTINEITRYAQCSYGDHAVVPTRPTLPFFQSRPDDSRDRYYCGCYGWD